uniref:Uncharacterized protein n=1 Tax=viral metagenome TaxID=1070528 RepID=A0A6M3Y6G2_9ZZZZ
MTKRETEIAYNLTVIGDRTMIEAYNHWNVMSNLALCSFVDFNKKFMDEVIDYSCANLPLRIVIHQNQRWYDIIRSN